MRRVDHLGAYQCYRGRDYGDTCTSERKAVLFPSRSIGTTLPRVLPRLADETVHENSDGCDTSSNIRSPLRHSLSVLSRTIAYSTMIFYKLENRARNEECRLG